MCSPSSAQCPSQRWLSLPYAQTPCVQSQGTRCSKGSHLTTPQPAPLSLRAPKNAGEGHAQRSSPPGWGSACAVVAATESLGPTWAVGLGCGGDGVSCRAPRRTAAFGCRLPPSPWPPQRSLAAKSSPRMYPPRCRRGDGEVYLSEELKALSQELSLGVCFLLAPSSISPGTLLVVVRHLCAKRPG